MPSSSPSSTLRSLKDRYGMLIWVLILCVILVGAGTAIIIYRMVKASKAKSEQAAASAAPAAASKPKDSFENKGDTKASAEEDEEEVPPTTEKFKASQKKTRELVYLHEPSCPFCVKFTPVWNEFASQYSGPLTLRKYTASSEEGQQYTTAGVPAVYLVVDGRQEKPFNESRSVDNLLRFAKENEA